MLQNPFIVSRPNTSVAVVRGKIIYFVTKSIVFDNGEYNLFIFNVSQSFFFEMHIDVLTLLHSSDLYIEKLKLIYIE